MHELSISKKHACIREIQNGAFDSECSESSGKFRRHGHYDVHN